MSAPGRLAMHGDVGMEIVFAQAKAFAKIAEGFGSFLAFGHGSSVLPFRRLAHFQNTIPPAAHDGVLEVAAEAETLSQPTAVLVSGNNPEFADLFYAYGVLDSSCFVGESSHLVWLGSNQASFYLRA